MDPYFQKGVLCWIRFNHGAKRGRAFSCIVVWNNYSIQRDVYGFQRIFLVIICEKQNIHSCDFVWLRFTHRGFREWLGVGSPKRFKGLFSLYIHPLFVLQTNPCICFPRNTSPLQYCLPNHFEYDFCRKTITRKWWYFSNSRLLLCGPAAAPFRPLPRKQLWIVDPENPTEK